jgi:hypothetical protein
MPTPDTYLDKWFRADFDVFIDGTDTTHSTTNGDPCAHWYDRAVSVVFDNTVHPAVFRPTGIGGKPAVQGDGTAAGLNGTALDGATDFTFWCVFKPGASPADDERLVEKTGCFYVRRIGADNWGATLASTPLAVPDPVLDANPHMVILKRAGTSATLKFDGESNKVTGVTVPGTAFTSSALSIFYNFNGGSPSNIGSSIIADWGYKAGATSDADDAQLFGYANSYYFGMSGGGTVFRRGNSSRSGSRAARRQLGSL